MRKRRHRSRSARPPPRCRCSAGDAIRRRRQPRQPGISANRKAAAISRSRPTAPPATPCPTGKPFAGGRADRNAVRQHRRAEHHAGSRDRHRRLDRRGVRRRRAQGHPARRRASLSGDAVHRLHQDVARRRAGDPRLSQDVAPVHNQVVANTLPFPFNIRAAMRVWDALLFHGGRIQARPATSRRNGIAAPSWCKGPDIAAPATRRRIVPRRRQDRRISARLRTCRAGSRRTSPTMRGAASAAGRSGDIASYLKTGHNTHDGGDRADGREIADVELADERQRPGCDRDLPEIAAGAR